MAAEAKKRNPTAVGIAYPKKEPKTVVVIGSGRGGTSVVAGVVHLLGVRMFERAEANSEDADIVQAFQGNMKSGFLAAVREVNKVISERNRRYEVWGWKDPSADLYIESVAHQLRNPHFILVFRNPLDVAISHVETKTGSLEIGLDSGISRYVRCWGLVQKFGCPTLFVSYERAIKDGKAFASEVCSFLDIRPSEKQFDSAIKFVNPAGGYTPAVVTKTTKKTRRRGR